MALAVRNPGHDQCEIHWQRSTGCGEFGEPLLGPSQPTGRGRRGPLSLSQLTQGGCGPECRVLTEALVEPELQAQGLR